MKPIRELEISGCWELQQFRYADERGVFAKAYHTSDLQKHELSFEVREVFWSMSGKGNIRGMHFQIPPHHHHKLVSCQQGKILDVLLDLRKNSTSYGVATSLELDARQGNAVYIPPGVAHGFQSLESESLVLYLTSREHYPESDKGVLWNSFNFSWPLTPTQISGRDQNHPTLLEFSSPF